MDSLMFLGLVAGLVVLFAVRQSTQVRAVLQKHSNKFGLLPKTIGMLVLIAQLTELVKMLDHLTIVNATGSLFLLAIMSAAKSGTEGEWL